MTDNKIISRLISPEKLILYGILTLSVGLRISEIGWYDKDALIYALISRRIILEGFNSFFDRNGYWASIDYRFGDHPPLFFLLVSFSFLVMGMDYVNGCIVSLVAGTFAVSLVYFLAKELYDEKVGLLSSFFVAILPWHVFFSTIILVDMLGSTLILLSLYLFWIAIKRERLLNYIFMGVVLGASLLTKYYAVMVPLIIIPFLFLANRGLLLKKQLWFAFIIAGVIFAPWLFFVGFYPFQHYALTITLRDKVPNPNPLFVLTFLFAELTFPLFMFFTMGFLMATVRSYRFKGKNEEDLLMLIWIIVPAIVYTYEAIFNDLLHPYWNISGYFLLAIPPIIVLASNSFFDVYSQLRTSISKIKTNLVVGSFILLIILSLSILFAGRASVGAFRFNGFFPFYDYYDTMSDVTSYIEENVPENVILTSPLASDLFLIKFYLESSYNVLKQEDISQDASYYIVTRSTIDGYLLKVFESKTHPNFAFYLYYIS
ncbi:MAG: ArnT family glycosyltransferase [Promethearchaeota archaeon]